MISSISPRSPRKTCGLFDTGLAGGAADVTSQDLNAPADIYADSLFPFQDLKSAHITETYTTYNIDDGDALTGGEFANVQPSLMDNWDMLNPLAELATDQLADDSLDAFVNLDDFLMGDSFLDESIQEVQPVIDVSNVEMKSYGNFSQALTVVSPHHDFLLEEEQATSSGTKTRKRKLPRKPTPSKPVKTSMFEIPVSEDVVTSTTSVAANFQLDHDYSTKCQKMSAPSEINSKMCSSTNGNSKIKSAKVQGESKHIESENGNDKVTIRRMKNNVASKRSREQRKQKFADMDYEAEELTKANAELKVKIVELEKLAKEMKAKLIAKMAGN